MIDIGLSDSFWVELLWNADRSWLSVLSKLLLEPVEAVEPVLELESVVESVLELEEEPWWW